MHVSGSRSSTRLQIFRASPFAWKTALNSGGRAGGAVSLEIQIHPMAAFSYRLLVEPELKHVPKFTLSEGDAKKGG